MPEANQRSHCPKCGVTYQGRFDVCMSEYCYPPRCGVCGKPWDDTHGYDGKCKPPIAGTEIDNRLTEEQALRDKLMEHIRAVEAEEARVFARRVMEEDKKSNPTKPTNPKDKAAIKRPPCSTRSALVDLEVGIGMMEGGRKYRRHNYRVAGVLASVYYDATMRHLMYWWEGEDLDPDTNLNHISKAIASLYVLRDAMLHKGMFVDDRPPALSPEEMAAFRASLQSAIDAVFERVPIAREPWTELNKGEYNAERES